MESTSRTSNTLIFFPFFLRGGWGGAREKEKDKEQTEEAGCLTRFENNISSLLSLW